MQIHPYTLKCNVMMPPSYKISYIHQNAIENLHLKILHKCWWKICACYSVLKPKLPNFLRLIGNNVNSDRVKFSTGNVSFFLGH